MGSRHATTHRKHLSPFERFLLAQHFRDPEARAAEIARRREVRAAAGSTTAAISPQDRFYQIFLSADHS